MLKMSLYLTGNIPLCRASAGSHKKNNGLMVGLLCLDIRGMFLEVK